MLDPARFCSLAALFVSAGAVLAGGCATAEQRPSASPTSAGSPGSPAASAAAPAAAPAASSAPRPSASAGAEAAPATGIDVASPGDENTVVVRLERGDVDAVEIVRRDGKCSMSATIIRGGRPSVALAEVPLADCDRVLALVAHKEGDSAPSACGDCVSTFVGVTRRAKDGVASKALLRQRKPSGADDLSPLVAALGDLARAHVPSIKLSLFK